MKYDSLGTNIIVKRHSIKGVGLINVTTINADGKEGATTSVTDTLPAVLPQGAVTWIDVEGKDVAELHTLKDRFNLDEYSIEDVTVGNQRPKIEDYDEYNFSVVRVPVDSGNGITFAELFIFFSEKWIITIHTEKMHIVDMARDRIKARGLSFLRLKPATDLLYYLLVDFAVDTYYPVMDSKEEDIDNLEKSIEARIEERRSDIDKIRHVSRSFVSIKEDLMTLRRDASAMRDALGQIMRGAVPLIRDQTLRNFRDIYDHTFQLIETLDSYRERVNEVRDLHISLISASTNNVVKVLTIVVTVLTPLSLISGIYGTNFTAGFFSPGTGTWYGFYVMISAMVAIALGMIYLFKRAGWL